MLLKDRVNFSLLKNGLEKKPEHFVPRYTLCTRFTKVEPVEWVRHDGRQHAL